MGARMRNALDHVKSISTPIIQSRLCSEGKMMNQMAKEASGYETHRGVHKSADLLFIASPPPFLIPDRIAHIPFNCH
jgi:hypothetical protein